MSAAARMAANWALVGITFLWAVVYPLESPAQPVVRSLYFVAVGSSDYVEAAPEAGARGVRNIAGANTGARELATRLTQGGALFGVVLTSTRDRFVRTGDVWAAVDAAAARMKADRRLNPLLVVYFAGHGISEGVGWNHFSLPGDFTYRGELARLDVEGLAKATLHAAAIAERLKAVGVPYLLILDTCYEGQEAGFESPVLSGPAIEGLRNVAEILRFMNQFRQEEPVVFSTVPGTVVSTVQNPANPNGVAVGPLARRAILLLEAAAQDRRDVSLDAFVRGLTSRTLDQLTTPAVTWATPAPWWSGILVRNRATPGIVQTRTGTATRPVEICCAKPLASAALTSSLKGKVELVGSAGDFITGGQRITVGNDVLWIAEAAMPGDLVLRAETPSGVSWEIGLSTSDGERLTPRKYPRAVRHGFAPRGRPGLSVTGDGRACNDVQGEFTVREIAFRPDGLPRRLLATLQQYCDDKSAPLVATIDLQE